ncbi:hypothetical protein BN946_scf184658.g5 [Trametes cinnabarina]|uniref:Protein kinase domain-containing protein n=2 Tax=Pycnoporus cinnabarinus TaxID=5643 RepID=A0A060SZZ8_PYCCI|nr:hypothetical protein BN946_scf184658.g5 [Trametes cinnabarina]
MDSTCSNEEFFAVLTPVELWWQERQPFLAEHGYMLRPRHRHGWVASWLRDPSIDWFLAEDRFSMQGMRGHLLDARQTSDNKLVLIKRIRRDSPEIDIATYLSSPEMREDPRNHSVPVLDVICDPLDDTVSFLIMPFLKEIDNPPFESIENVLDCCEQLLEGLVFMHEKGVAHRDCSYRNLMVDANPLYPQGFHAIADMGLPDSPFDLAPRLSRRGVPLRYYYIDFGISTRYMPDEPREPVLGRWGLDRSVPELSDEVPYDPFKVDVFILGNTLGGLFLAVSHTSFYSCIP